MRLDGTDESDSYPVIKNPLSPVEHPGGIGVNCELFELGVEQFVVSTTGFLLYCSDADQASCRLHLFRLESKRITARLMA